VGYQPEPDWYRETTKPRRTIRIWKTLGSRDADAGLILRFDLSNLITQAGSFGAILFSFDTELDCADAAHRIHNLDNGTTLAVASMRELFGEIILVQGLGLDFVNTTVKVTDFRPTLGLRDDRIADRGSRILPLASIVLEVVGQNLEIIFALRISQVGAKPYQVKALALSVLTP